MAGEGRKAAIDRLPVEPMRGGDGAETDHLAAVGPGRLVKDVLEHKRLTSTSAACSIRRHKTKSTSRRGARPQPDSADETPPSIAEGHRRAAPALDPGTDLDDQIELMIRALTYTEHHESLRSTQSSSSYNEVSSKTSS